MPQPAVPNAAIIILFWNQKMITLLTECVVAETMTHYQIAMYIVIYL